jgi:hypothetical protein
MLKICLVVLSLLSAVGSWAAATNESEIRRNHIEDIFIWKISDELKMSVKEEKAFTEINKSLNKKKYDLNRQIQELARQLNAKSPQLESKLKDYRKLLAEYNQLSLAEYDSIKKLLGSQKFADYIRVKSELNAKLRSILAGERNVDKKEATVKLPPPKVIIESN